MVGIRKNYTSFALKLSAKELVKFLGSLLVLVLSLASFGMAQSQAINGTIRGRATDPTGAAIVGANVTVRNLETAFTRSVQTNDEGYYVIPTQLSGAALTFRAIRLSSTRPMGWAIAHIGWPAISVSRSTSSRRPGSPYLRTSRWPLRTFERRSGSLSAMIAACASRADTRPCRLPRMAPACVRVCS